VGVQGDERALGRHGISGPDRGERALKILRHLLDLIGDRRPRRAQQPQTTRKVSGEGNDTEAVMLGGADNGVVVLAADGPVVAVAVSIAYL